MIQGLKSFFLGFLLFLLAIVLTIPLGVWGVIELLISLFYKRRFWKQLGVLGEFILLLAVIVDVLGNVLCKVPFNRVLILPNGYQFGSRFDTISYVLGMNKINGTLTKTGLWLCNVLDWFDENHCVKAVENRRKTLIVLK